MEHFNVTQQIAIKEYVLMALRGLELRPIENFASIKYLLDTETIDYRNGSSYIVAFKEIFTRLPMSSCHLLIGGRYGSIEDWMRKAVMAFLCWLKVI